MYQLATAQFATASHV